MAEITRFGIDIAVNTHLDGTRIHYLFAQVVPQLKTDDSGNVVPEQIENFRKSLRAASREAPDEVTAMKCRKLLAFLRQF